MTVCLHQKSYLAVATPKHSHMKTSSNRSADPGQAEFVHINLTIRCKVDACRGTTHDSNQLCCIEYQVFANRVVEISHIFQSYFHQSINNSVSNDQIIHISSLRFSKRIRSAINDLSGCIKLFA